MCATAVKTQLNNSIQLIGKIYLATNTINGKVYVGKVEFPRTIRERWLEHYTEARKLKNLRDQNPQRKIWGSHLNNALLKYPRHIWKLHKIDIAYKKAELNKMEKFWIKKYDSMNPEKGYNMREGGEGGKVREEVKEKISYIIKRKYREDPIYRERMRFLSKERMKDPEYKAQHVKWLHDGLKKKRQDKEFRKKYPDFVYINHGRRYHAYHTIFYILSKVSLWRKETGKLKPSYNYFNLLTGKKFIIIRKNIRHHTDNCPICNKPRTIENSEYRREIGKVYNNKIILRSFRILDVEELRKMTQRNILRYREDHMEDELISKTGDGFG